MHVCNSQCQVRSPPTEKDTWTECKEKTHARGVASRRQGGGERESSGNRSVCHPCCCKGPISPTYSEPPAGHLLGLGVCPPARLLEIGQGWLWHRARHPPRCGAAGQASILGAAVCAESGAPAPSLLAAALAPGTRPAYREPLPGNRERGSGPGPLPPCTAAALANNSCHVGRRVEIYCGACA